MLGVKENMCLTFKKLQNCERKGRKWWGWGARREIREERGTFLVAQGLRLCRAHGFDPWS